MLRPLLALLALLPALAGAGYYRITTSGGTVESTGPGGRYTGGYEHTPAGGTTGPGQSAQALGEVRTGGYAPPGTGPGGASCGEAVTASFVWVRDSPQDDPPSAVVVEKTASAYAYGDSPAADAGMDDSDLLDLGTTLFSAGSAYEVQGGESFEVAVEPSASASDDQYGTCGVSVIVSCTPVTLSVAGTIPDADGDLQGLIGLQQIASVETGTYEAKNHVWSVSGDVQTFEYLAQPPPDGLGQFSREYVNKGLGTAPPPPAPIRAFYASKDGDEAVTCMVDLYLPGTTTLIGSVTVEREVTILAPEAFFKIVDISLLPPGVDNFSNPIRAYSGDPLTVEFRHRAETPDPFTGGSVAILQKLAENTIYSPAPPGGHFGFATPRLDDSFPYDNVNAADGTLWTNDNDTPFDYVIPGTTGLNLNVAFMTTSMYQPVGGVYVPLLSQPWTWNMSATRNLSGNWVTNSGSIGIQSGFGAPFVLPNAEFGKVARSGHRYDYATGNEIHERL